MTKLVIGSLLLVACLGGAGNGIPPEPRGGENNSKAAVDVLMYNSPFEWQRSPYYRIGDDSLTLPIFVAIADDRTACFITADRWATFHPEQRVPCAGQWRSPRP